MKLDELNTSKGTYAGIHFSDKTLDALEQFNRENNIPNPLKRNKMHATLLYSRKFCPSFVPAGKFDPPVLIGYPSKLDVFESRSNEGVVSRCLVVKLASTYLQIRHANLMQMHSATYDYPVYTPHITLSYDIGDLDISALPPVYAKIEMVEEYGMDLDLDWAAKNAK